MPNCRLIRVQPAFLALPLILALALVLGGPAVVYADHAHDHGAGWDAYQSGNYEQAFHIWRELAEAGSPNAQHNVGLLYAQGKGVSINLEQAFYWYHLAAEQGDVPSQLRVALMLANGIGVEHDHVAALTWFKIAQASGDENADQATALIADMKEFLDHIHHRITEEEEALATERAKAWVPTHQTKHVGGER